MIGFDFWVFGYGSLMWRPGFEYEEARPALLYGYHRALCILSTRYRGTPDRPGLVLGLDRGGSCRGWAFRVAHEDVLATVDYLDKRELVTGVYRPTFLTTRLNSWRKVKTYTYVVQPSHPQYAGRLDLTSAATLVRQGHGMAGPAVEYLANTVAQMQAIGIRDRYLEAVLARCGDETGLG